MREKIKVQIIFAGIGGQGILFSSKVFSLLGLRLGLNVLGSETHGMSQRGGSVITHLKLGDFQSPMIWTGGADILYSLDKNETYRALKFLKEGGLCFASEVSSDRFDSGVIGYLKEKGITFLTFDAGRIALEIGSARLANVVLIGFSVGTGLVPFGYEDLRAVLEHIGKDKKAAPNMMAFETGYREGRHYLAKR